MAKKATAKKPAAKRAPSKKKKLLTKADVMRKCRQLNNWGKWGKDDQLGVLNYITPEMIADAAKLVKKGKVFRLGLNLDENGPQNGLFGGRWNPMHQMLATGTDAVQGIQEPLAGMRYADDAINLPTQCAPMTRCGTVMTRLSSTSVAPTRTALSISPTRWSAVVFCST